MEAAPRAVLVRVRFDHPKAAAAGVRAPKGGRRLWKAAAAVERARTRQSTLRIDRPCMCASRRVGAPLIIYLYTYVSDEEEEDDEHARVGMNTRRRLCLWNPGGGIGESRVTGMGRVWVMACCRKYVPGAHTWGSRRDERRPLNPTISSSVIIAALSNIAAPPRRESRCLLF
jgi:hypothetical protein